MAGSRTPLSAVGGLLLLVAGLGLLRATGIFEDLPILRAWVTPIGAAGPVAIIGLYAVGSLVQVPGSVFVGLSVLLYGPFAGGLLAFAGASAANGLAFGIVRQLRPRGGEAPAPLPASIARRLSGLTETAMWAQLASRPALAVTAVRCVFPTTAVVSFALAFTSVGWRPYLIGSLLGVLPQLSLTVFAFAWATG